MFKDNDDTHNSVALYAIALYGVVFFYYQIMWKTNIRKTEQDKLEIRLGKNSNKSAYIKKFEEQYEQKIKSEWSTN